MKTNAPSAEPSMDEILASIRKIISETPKAEKKPSSPQNQEEDILDLTEALPEGTSFDKSEGISPTTSGKKEKAKQVQPFSRKDSSKLSSDKISSRSEQLSEIKSKNTFEDPLVSPTAISEAAQALSSLNKLAQKKPRIPEPRLNDGIGGQTVEDLVREILKPLLKEWLDANLPPLVRWVVNEQVEKIVHRLGVNPSELSSDEPKHPSESS